MNSRLAGKGILLLPLLFVAMIARSETLYVDPGGGGDFLTVHEALDAAATRDTILLAPGVHDAGANGVKINAEVDVASVVLMGQGNPEETTLRGSGDNSGTLKCDRTTPETIIANITIEDDLVQTAGVGVVVANGAATMRNCVIRGAYNNQGVSLVGPSNLSVIDCEFDVPSAVYGIEGRAAFVAVMRTTIEAGSWALDVGTAAIDSSLILGSDRGIAATELSLTNSRVTSCGGWFLVDADFASIEGCVFDGNGPLTQTPGFVIVGSGSSIERCTFAFNAADTWNDLGRAIVHVDGDAEDVSLTTNVFAFNDATDIRTLRTETTVSCNLFWENGQFSHLGIAELDASNTTADPLFCDAIGGDFTLDAASPAASENSGGCGLIGALSVSCGVPLDAPVAGGAAQRLRVSPNPFNPTTRLRIALDGLSSPIDLGIYDVTGREVRRLLEKEPFNGSLIIWDGRDDAGMPLGNGVYFVRMSSDGESTAARAVLVR